MEGFAPFTPWHDKTFVFDNWNKELTVSMFYNYSKEWLQCSDAVFVIPNSNGLTNWQDSKGTNKEIEIANQFNIPVFFSIDDLIKWRDEN